LNHGGMLKYFKSVSSAVLHARHSIGNNINIPIRCITDGCIVQANNLENKLRP
jgi:hypothetical protein